MVLTTVRGLAPSVTAPVLLEMVITVRVEVPLKTVNRGDRVDD